jgi:hypothetical protein
MLVAAVIRQGSPNIYTCCLLQLCRLLHCRARQQCRHPLHKHQWQNRPLCKRQQQSRPPRKRRYQQDHQQRKHRHRLPALLAPALTRPLTTPSPALNRQPSDSHGLHTRPAFAMWQSCWSSMTPAPHLITVQWNHLYVGGRGHFEHMSGVYLSDEICLSICLFDHLSVVKRLA